MFGGAGSAAIAGAADVERRINKQVTTRGNSTERNIDLSLLNDGAKRKAQRTTERVAGYDCTEAADAPPGVAAWPQTSAAVCSRPAMWSWINGISTWKSAGLESPRSTPASIAG